MKQKLKLRSILAVLLAFVVVFAGIDPMGFFFKTAQNVHAEGTEETEFTEISWSNFKRTSNSTALANGDTITNTSGTGPTKAAYTGESLDKTAFEGDISFASGSYFRYATQTGWFGLKIAEADGTLTVGGTLGVELDGIADGVKYTLDAEDYNVGDTFTDTRFTIRIELYNLVTNSTENSSSANVNIYINGIQVESKMSLITDTSNSNYMLGSSIGFWNAAGGTGVTVYDVKPELTEIGWSDFIRTKNSVALASGDVITDEAVNAKYTGGTLNKTAFEGDVSIPAGSGFRYAVPSAYHGLTIKESAGSLVIGTTNANIKLGGQSGDVFTLSAMDYELSTFTDERFTVRIEFWGLSEDSLSAKVCIYINGIQVGSEMTLVGSDSYETLMLGNGVGFAQNGLATGITIYDVKPELTEIGWSDFYWPKNSRTLTDGETITDTDVHTKVGTNGAGTLNNTAFEGDVSIPAGSGFRYAVPSAYYGLTIKESAGSLIIGTNYTSMKLGGKTGDVFTLNAVDYGLSTFTEERFTVRIELWNLSKDNLSARVCIYINGIQVGSEMTLEAPGGTYSSLYLGNGVGFAKQELATGITIYDVAPSLEEVATGLEVVSWEEFAYTGGITTTAADTGVASHLNTLSGYLFDGDVVMQTGTEIRYAETSDKDAGGVSVKVDSDGTLTASLVFAGTATKTYTAIASHHDVSSFADTQFNLKIAYTADAKISVWINNAIVGNPFDTNLTFGTTLYMVNADITPISLRTTVPTGLTEISFDDWTQDNANTVSQDGTLTNQELRGRHSDKTTLINTSLHEVVKFVDTNDTVGKHKIVYGGVNTSGDTSASHRGIWISLDDDDSMIIYCTDSAYDETEEKTTVTAVEKFTLDPVTAGVGTTFRGVEFSWKLDTVQLGEHVLLYMSFNGELYNDAPFVFHDFADSMGASMRYYSYEQSSEDDTTDPSDCYVILGASIKELPVLYHDLSKGTYSIPAYTSVTVSQKDENGEWKEIETLKELTTLGDYLLAFNDGLSDYTQIVSIYHYETDVDVAALVRSLKMADGTEETWENYETRLCDKDFDGQVTEDDISEIRSMLLGTYVADTDVMKISGFFSPTASMIEADTYAAIKATGVNHIIESNMYYKDDALARYRIYQELSYAQQYGLTVTVNDQRLTDIGAAGGEATADDVKNYVANYKDYQSFAGLFIVDEPKSADYPKGVWADHNEVGTYSSVAKAIAEAGYEGWSNAFTGDSGLLNNSYNWNCQNYMRYGYYTYLQNMVDSLYLDFISSTHYPFLKNATCAGDNMWCYFMNLAMTKKVADTKNIELRTFVQGMAADEDELNTTYNEAQLKWNANMNLTFGAHALEYFPLVQPGTFLTYEDGSCASGLLDKDGIVTTFGQWATDVNQQVQAIDHILLNATHEGFMAIGGDSAYATTIAKANVASINMKSGLFSSETITHTFNESGYEDVTVTASDTTNGAFAGCFAVTGGAYDGKHAMYIVNYNDAGENTISVDLPDGVSATAIYQGMESVYEADFDVKLAAGDAVLVVY